MPRDGVDDFLASGQLAHVAVESRSVFLIIFLGELNYVTIGAL